MRRLGNVCSPGMCFLENLYTLVRVHVQACIQSTQRLQLTKHSLTLKKKHSPTKPHSPTDHTTYHTYTHSTILSQIHPHPSTAPATAVHGTRQLPSTTSPTDWSEVLHHLNCRTLYTREYYKTPSSIYPCRSESRRPSVYTSSGHPHYDQNTPSHHFVQNRGKIIVYSRQNHYSTASYKRHEDINGTKTFSDSDQEYLFIHPPPTPRQVDVRQFKKKVRNSTYSVRISHKP